jgi:hypothetical protein
MANAFQSSRLAPTGLQLQACPPQSRQVENFTTLEQAYSPEYQRVQGAFKDSMIH